MNNAVSISTAPGHGGPVLRMGGALALVIGLFLAGVWLFKNWQRLALRRGAAPQTQCAGSQIPWASARPFTWSPMSSNGCCWPPRPPASLS